MSFIFFYRPHCRNTTVLKHSWLSLMAYLGRRNGHYKWTSVRPSTRQYIACIVTFVLTSYGSERSEVRHEAANPDQSTAVRMAMSTLAPIVKRAFSYKKLIFEGIYGRPGVCAEWDVNYSFCYTVSKGDFLHDGGRIAISNHVRIHCASTNTHRKGSLRAIQYE
jgi:hypothetical protein